MPFLKQHYRVFGMLLLVLGLAVGWLIYSNILEKTPMPDIVFICIKYDELQHEPSEITFMDKYGNCYWSDDSDVVGEGFYSKIFCKEYREGKIADKIKLCKSCNRYEVIRKYRQMRKIPKRIAKSGGLSTNRILYERYIVGGSPTEQVLEGVYFNEYRETEGITIKEKHVKYEEVINDWQGDRIYEWYNDIMKDIDE